ncbi:DrmB family protein [Paenisporosarcina quisquiliarum]|uniref:DrmB family protein n=1 Tax=Paenisporosarcina quisquiliarum TaxID=365346 RepID=UPI003736B4F6
MRRLQLRRSQLVGSNGPGSLIVSPEGETAIVGALDYWLQDSRGNDIDSKAEFEIFEPRLKGFLGVNKLYLPPDYRDVGPDVANAKITIPLLRFPKWHYCPFCHTMHELNYTIESARNYCSECENHRYYKQVPFIIICSSGHISDFPWREWVHHSDQTICKGRMKLITVGGATLDSWKITCLCGAGRSLKGITSNNSEKPGGTVLSEKLNSMNKDFKCKGHKAWCGDEFEECNENPVAILRNSINVYMPQKISVISLPGEKNQDVDRLLETLQRNIAVLGALEAADTFEGKVNILYSALSTQINVSREDYEKAVLYLEKGVVEEGNTIEVGSPLLLRNKEYEKLQDECAEEYLKVQVEWTKTDNDSKQSASIYQPFFNRVNRVTQLRETTALSGFKRLSRTDENGKYSYTSSFDLMYHKEVANNQKWLPAYTVYGEGIFIQFDLEKIAQWEQEEAVKTYFEKYKERINNMEHIMPEIIESPRNIMMHTLAHLIIEEISNTSGYNMASIRERLYMNANQASILIYTSAGDIEGTFGGLVRLGRKDKFFKLIDNSIMSAQWCSSDPVCTELAESQGQGIQGVNGAACYNCVHLPETSCEVGNMYLDRNLISNPNVGFFKSIF